MAFVYVDVGGTGQKLRASTPDPDSAPVTYQFRNRTFTENELANIRMIADGVIQIGSSQFIVGDISNSLVAGMSNAISEANNKLATMVTTVPSSTTAAQEPDPVPSPTPVTDPTSFTGQTDTTYAINYDPATVSLSDVENATDINATATSVNAPATLVDSNQAAPDAITGEIRYNPTSLTVDSVAAAEGTDLSGGIKYNPATLTEEQVTASAGDIGKVATSPNATQQPITGPENATKGTPPRQEQDPTFDDWRVRLSLANGANYLYKSSDPGILAPLVETSGVIFPYTPQIGIQYAAQYEPTQVVHSNYKIQQYTGSSVDAVNITADFTAQDVFEARYLLAVIHFFKSVTKMWYGQDTAPIAGTPPPLCYLTGLGGFQFNHHPLAVTSFQYNLPTDVDYIKTSAAQPAGTAIQSKTSDASTARRGDKIAAGGTTPAPSFSNPSKGWITYVPTKIQLVIGCVPMMSRLAVSSKFSLDEYGRGNLMLGNENSFGGMW